LIFFLYIDFVEVVAIVDSIEVAVAIVDSIEAIVAIVDSIEVAIVVDFAVLLVVELVELVE
jgi:hypothetical protein